MALLPTGGESKTDTYEDETDHHVPILDPRNGVIGSRDVEDHNPEEADKECRDHDGGKPTRAFFNGIEGRENFAGLDSRSALADS